MVSLIKNAVNKPILFANSPSREVAVALSQIAKKKGLRIKSLRFLEKNSTEVREKNNLINGWALVNRGLKGKFDPVAAPLTNWDVHVEKELAFVQRDCLKMIDRMDPSGTINYEQRQMLFRYLVCYWCQYLKSNPIKIFFSQSVPHEVTDYVLFSLCRLKKIKTILINYTWLPGRYFCGDSIRPPHRINKNNSQQKLPKSIQQAMSQITMTHQEASPKILKKMLSENQNYKFRLKADDYSKFLLGNYKRVFKYKNLVVLKKKYCYPRYKLANKIKEIKYYEKLDDFTKNCILYSRIAKNTIPNKPFVYFCLNYQPEMTTSPMGGVFADMFLAVAVIARYLPKKWIIAVKEHPGQYLDYGSYNYIGRSKNFYRPYAGIPNLQFVSLDIPHFDLLDQSKCVACVNGTVGWQAMVRQKPVMVFGEAWYKFGPGVFPVANAFQCKKALAEIQKGIVLSKNKTVKWLTQFLQNCTNEIYLTKEEAEEWGGKFNASKTISEIKNQLDKLI